MRVIPRLIATVALVFVAGAAASVHALGEGGGLSLQAVVALEQAGGRVVLDGGAQGLDRGRVRVVDEDALDEVLEE